MGTRTVEQLSDFVKTKIAARGLVPGDSTQDEGFTIVRIKDEKNRVLSSVTFPNSVTQMEDEGADLYLDGLVLERCRAAVKEPVLRG